MTDKGDTRGSIKGNTFSVIFGALIAFAAFVCIVGMIYCCVLFALTIKTFSTEYKEALKSISVGVSSGTLSSAWTEADSFISHMERMIAIQESGMTNDLMSFIYGVLSTILVGVCAGFVVKSQVHADEAKKKVEEAEKNAKIAKEQAEKAAKEAEGTEKTIAQANNASEDARKNAENSKKQAEFASMKANETEEMAKKIKAETEEVKKNAEIMKEQVEIAAEKAKGTEEAIKQAQIATTAAKELRYQVRLIIVLSRILSAKSALMSLDNIYANRAIIQIHNEIDLLFKDDCFLAGLNGLYMTDIETIYNDLHNLDEDVDDFWEKCREKMEKGKMTADTLESKKCAAKNYHKWIKEAIECIDNASETAQKTVAS